MWEIQLDPILLKLLVNKSYGAVQLELIDCNPWTSLRFLNLTFNHIQIINGYSLFSLDTIENADHWLTVKQNVSKSGKKKNYSVFGFFLVIQNVLRYFL